VEGIVCQAPTLWVANGGLLAIRRALTKVGGVADAHQPRGPGRKPGASSYTLTRLSLSLSLVAD